MNQDENLDPMMNGEIAGTPTASPAEMITPGESESVNQQGAGSLSPEEVEWNNLKGHTQDRIKQILKERNDWMQRAQVAPTAPVYSGQPQNDTPKAPEVTDAVRRLSEVGIATKDEVQETVNRSIGNLVYSFEIEKLTNRYDGANGLPKFDKDEYEDYVNRYPQYRNYAPEDVYEKMYSEEILDWRSQQRGKPSTQQQSPSLRPTKTQVREEPWTPELIEQRLREPDGLQWYEKNKDRINTVVAKQGGSE